jgi:WD40 repeat protein/mono/diheme cytochrome c family protein
VVGEPEADGPMSGRAAAGAPAGLFPVEPGPLAAVRISPRRPRRSPGESCCLVAVACDEAGTAIPDGVAYKWRIVAGEGVLEADGASCRVTSAAVGLVGVEVSALQAAAPPREAADRVEVKFLIDTAGDDSMVRGIQACMFMTVDIPDPQHYIVYCTQEGKGRRKRCVPSERTVMTLANTLACLIGATPVFGRSECFRPCSWAALTSLVIAATAAVLHDPGAAAEPLAPVSYHRQIRPIFQARCQGCHQPAKLEGGFVMTEVPRMFAAGDSGSAGIVPGKPAESMLIAQITPDASGHAEMPKESKPLDESEIALVSRWILQGAQDDTPVSAGQKVDAAHPPIYTRQPVVTSLDFSPDGTLLAVSGFHEVLVFDVAATDASGPGVAPVPKLRLVGLSERVERVRFSPDGKRLAVTGGNPARMGEVQIWEVATGALLLSHPVSFDTIYGGAWSPDGTLVAVGCTDNSVRVIDASSGRQVLFQGAHEDWVLDTVFSPKGDHVISLGRDMSVKLTELATQRFIDNITSITPGALRGGLMAVDRHPTLEHVVAAGADGTPRAYRIHRHSKRVIGDDANFIFPLHPVSGRVFGLRFSSDGKRVAAVGGLDGRGELVVASYGLEADVPRAILDIMAKVPGENRTKGSQRTEADWEAFDEFREASTKLLAKVEVPETTLYAIAFHPRSGEVAVSGADGIVRFFDAAGAPRRQFPVARLDAAAVGPDKPPLPWPAEGSFEPDPAAPAGITALEIEPAEIMLDGPFAATQLLVMGRLADGRRFDLTRSVSFSTDGAADVMSLVSIGPGGLVRPRADGAGSLRIVHRAGDAAVAATVDVRVVGTGAMPDVDFVRDINPVLTRMGCNQGTCHGAAKGKNGFKLSLRGYDPVFDLRAFTDDHGSRRVNTASPDDSLMLLKASATVPHQGGLLARVEDPNYQLVRRWIEEGAGLNLSTPRVAKISVSPAVAMVDLPDRRQQFRVVATYADGSSRDVTRQAFLESGNTEVATVDPTGLVTAVRRGEAPILVRYEGSYAAVTLTVMGDRTGFQWRQPESWGRIDDLVAAKWQAMQIEPAPLCNDAEFLRRVTLDLTGLPPTSADVKAFLADSRDVRIKRAALVQQLLASDAFVEHWTNKWADLLQVNPKFLGLEGARGLRDWIRGQIAANTPYDRFAREILTATGSNREHPAAAYFKTLRDPALTMENTTHLFLGVRFNCNKCHDHPFERWTQDQYYETAAFFAQVALEKDPESKDRTIGGSAVEGAKPLWEIVKDAPSGEIKHERTGKDVPPKFPFECRFETPSEASRRQQLAAWITSPDNPYFARSYVNRLWGYLFGTGVIDPIDDIRAGNPPSNPALLAHLTKSFVDGGFDMRKALAEICTSRTYGLAITSSKWNDDDKINYSHALPRRLPAETLFDSLHAAVGSPTKFAGYPVGTRAAQLPEVASALGGGFLQTFGKPARESACECERAGGVGLGPVMALISGPTVGDALADPDSDLAKLVANQPDDRLLIDEVFLRILNRPSRPAEATTVTTLMQSIAADHEALVQALASAEEAWKPEKTKQEQARIELVSKRKAALERATMAYEPTRIILEKERAERIAAAAAAIERHDVDRAAALRYYEEQAAKMPVWQVAKPVEITSVPGTTFETLADGSVLVSGTQGAGTTISFKTDTAIGKVTGLRLETIPDPRLPAGGAGRAADGSFVVSDVKVDIAPALRPGNLTTVTLLNPQADFSGEGFSVARAADNGASDPDRGWSVAPRQQEYHWAIFELAGVPEIDDPLRAVVRIRQGYKGGLHGLGRFRVSFTASQTPHSIGVSARAAELAVVSPEKRSPADTEELKAIVEARDLLRERLTATLAAASLPLPPDPKLVALAADLADAEKPIADDPKLVQLRADVVVSTKQVADRRLTAIQDLAWALINSPAFFFNH